MRLHAFKRFTAQSHADESRSTRPERLGRSAGEELREKRIGVGRDVSAGRRRGVSAFAGWVVTECPLSTSDGVKAIDVAFLTAERRQEVRSVTCLLQAPEICVEVLSPTNTSEEISEKIALYFESVATEVWLCDHGILQFHFPAIPKISPLSGMCPTFPPQFDLRIVPPTDN